MLCNDSAQFKEQAEANTQNELQAMTREISLPNALLASEAEGSSNRGWSSYDVPAD
ncbi:hypothetical protein ACET3Z_006484 [Daucus carota]